jgi:hypothetical protein
MLRVVVFSSSPCSVFVISSQFSFQLNSLHLPLSYRSEANQLRDLLYIAGVQHVSAEDMLFLRNYHTSIRSIPVVVINFTLNGKFADPCDPTDLPGMGGPFISYVREDDDYQAILRRLTAMTGDKEDTHKLRLAVIESKLPYFVPRPRSTLQATLSVPSIAALAADPPQQATQPLNGADAEIPLNRTESLPRLAGPDTSASAVWTLLLEKYPNVLTWSDMPSKSFPLIGIQRSAADVASKSRYCMLDKSFFVVVEFGLKFSFSSTFAHRTMRGGGSIKIV